jgi:hypothetical protein
MTLATNTKDANLCRKIRIPPGTRDARLSLQATCLFQVNSPYPSNTTYAPEVPVNDDQTRRLIIRLNYDIPRARDLPPEEIYQAYSRFLDELERPADPVHAAARQRFLDRVYRLPNRTYGAAHSSSILPATKELVVSSTSLYKSRYS